MKAFFYVLIVIIIMGFLYYHYTCYTTTRESMIPSLSSYQSINNLTDMRNFLEELYTICYTNPNTVVSSGGDNVKNTRCYQISILGTYIQPILGSIASQPMELLFSTYGSPKPSPMGASSGDLPPGIITSTQDYIMLLQLYIAGSNLAPFASGAFPVWSQDLSGNTTITTDMCESIDQSNSDIVGYATELYNIAKTSLKHFHNQITNSKSVTYGDTADTTPYTEGMADYYSKYISTQCAQGKKSICKGAPVASDFYSQYVTRSYTDFPNAGTYALRSYAPADITKFRVLLIGASGGGGSAASGKWNNNGPDQTGGGGGGGGGGGISASTTYPYTNNYQIVVGRKGNGGSTAYAVKNGRPGNSGNMGNASNLYDSSINQTLLTAGGGYGGGGGYNATGNSGGNNYTQIGNQGVGGNGGTGLSKTGNAGEGGANQSRYGANAGESEAWSTTTESVIKPITGGVGGNCGESGHDNGKNNPGNAGGSGKDGFARVYWIP